MSKIPNTHGLGVFDDGVLLDIPSTKIVCNEM